MERERLIAEDLAMDLRVLEHAVEADAEDVKASVESDDEPEGPEGPEGSADRSSSPAYSPTCPSGDDVLDEESIRNYELYAGVAVRHSVKRDRADDKSADESAEKPGR
jgi:hypothetical protein